MTYLLCSCNLQLLAFLLAIYVINCSASVLGDSGVGVFCNYAGGPSGASSFSLSSVMPNPTSLMYFASEGHFRVNMTALNREGITYADIQLIKRVPWYYSLARDVLESSVVADALVPVSAVFAPILELFYGPVDGSGLGMPGFGAGADRYRDRVENNVVLDKLTSVYGLGHGEMSEWTRLPPPCTSRYTQTQTQTTATGTDETGGATGASECSIRTNPLADMCIVVTMNHRRVIRDAETMDTSGGGGGDGSTAVVEYTLERPLLSSAWVWGLGAELRTELALYVAAIKSGAAAGGEELHGLDLFLYYVQVVVAAVVSFVDASGIVPLLIDPATSLLGQLPLAVVCLATGIYGFTHVEELVSDWRVQYLVLVTGGLVMSVLTFVIMIFSFFKNMVPQVPFANSLFGLMLLFPAALLGNSTTLFFIKKFFSGYVLLFWREGMFGIRWIGKVYVGIYVLGCMAMSKYFRLFGQGTYSRWCITQSMQACAVMLVLHGSTSVEITWPIVVLLYTYDYLAANCPSWYVHIAGYFSKSSTCYSGRVISKAEYEAEGRYYTEKALKDLQQQLAADPRATARVSDSLYKEGKHLQASMLKRFANGDYSGLPENNPRRFSSYYTQLQYFMVPKYVVYVLLAILVASGAVYFYLNTSM